MTPTAQPIASRVVVRSGSRFNLAVVPWAVCLAVDLTAFRASVCLIDFMTTDYPKEPLCNLSGRSR